MGRNIDGTGLTAREQTGGVGARRNRMKGLGLGLEEKIAMATAATARRAEAAEAPPRPPGTHSWLRYYHYPERGGLVCLPFTREGSE